MFAGRTATSTFSDERRPAIVAPQESALSMPTDMGSLTIDELVALLARVPASVLSRLYTEMEEDGANPVLLAFLRKYWIIVDRDGAIAYATSDGQQRNASIIADAFGHWLEADADWVLNVQTRLGHKGRVKDANDALFNRYRRFTHFLLAEEKDERSADSFLRRAFTKLAKRDPRKAAAIIAREDYASADSISLVYALSKAWGQTHPTEALEWARSLANQQYATAAERAVLTEWAKKDPFSAQEDIAALPKTLRALPTYTALVESLAEQGDWSTSLEWLNTNIAFDSLRDRILRDVTLRWNTDMESPLSALLEHELAYEPRTVASIAEQLAAIDKDAALAVLERPLRPEDAIAVWEGIARQNPEAGVVEARSAVDDAAVIGIARGLHTKRPDIALSLLKNVAPSPLATDLQGIAGAALRSWAVSRPEAAAEWMASDNNWLSDTVEQKRAAYEVARELARVDGREAEAWVARLNENIRDGAVIGLSKHFQDSNLEASLSWAARIQDTAERRRYLSNLAVSVGPSRALEQLLENSPLQDSDKPTTP